MAVLRTPKGRAQRAPACNTSNGRKCAWLQERKIGPVLERTEEERLEVKLERVLKYSQCMMAVAVDLNC